MGGETRVWIVGGRNHRRRRRFARFGAPLRPVNALLELLLPDLRQNRHGRQTGGLTGDLRAGKDGKEMKAIGSDLQSERLLLLFGSGQAKGGQDQAVALVPMG